MHTYSTFSREYSVKDTPFIAREYKIYNSGSCQCFKDCDCIERKGNPMGTRTTYTHPLSIKTFSSLLACRQSWDALKPKHFQGIGDT